MKRFTSFLGFLLVVSCSVAQATPEKTCPVDQVLETIDSFDLALLSSLDNGAVKYVGPPPSSDQKFGAEHFDSEDKTLAEMGKLVADSCEKRNVEPTEKDFFLKVELSRESCPVTGSFHVRYVEGKSKATSGYAYLYRYEAKDPKYAALNDVVAFEFTKTPIFPDQTGKMDGTLKSTKYGDVIISAEGLAGLNQDGSKVLSWRNKYKLGFKDCTSEVDYKVSEDDSQSTVDGVKVDWPKYKKMLVN